MSNSKIAEYFDLKSLSEYSSLAIPTLRDYLKIGLPHFRLKGKILVRRSDFDTWIEHYRVDANSELTNVVDEILGRLEGDND